MHQGHQNYKAYSTDAQAQQNIVGLGTQGSPVVSRISWGQIAGYLRGTRVSEREIETSQSKYLC